MNDGLMTVLELITGLTTTADMLLVCFVVQMLQGKFTLSTGKICAASKAEMHIQVLQLELPLY